MCYLQEKRWKEQEVEVSSQHMNNRGLQVLQKTKKQPEEAAEPPTTLAMEIQFHRQDEQVSTLLGRTEKMQR